MRDNFYSVSMDQCQWNEIFGKKEINITPLMPVVGIQKKSPPMYCSKCGREIREEIFYWSPGVAVCKNCVDKEKKNES